MTVSVQSEPFDVAAEMAALTAGDRDIGAVVSFTGLVREMTDAGAISDMTLEHYPGMTERALEEIVAEARARWPLQGVRLIHRYGAMSPGEGIVLVLTASRHRKAAFEAAEFLMDYLKTRAPFWKKETGADGGQWVDARDSDGSAAARWEKSGG
ncbi:MAG: molybdopterin synthase catalytic subunit MoaE [Paracoccaceae bacterium]